MPYIVRGEPSTWKDENYSKDTHKYDYPYGLNLKPGSELHNFLRTEIWNRARTSRNEMQKRFDTWREVDRTLTIYMPLKDVEEKIQKKDASKPVSIVFPYTYAMMESLLTYLVLAFFQDPIFQYEGVEDDDTIGAMLMELVINLQCNKHKVPLNIHTALRDSLAYGIGVGVPEWRKSYGRKYVKSSIVTLSDNNEETQPQTQSHIVDGLLFEGNALSNIDPYMWLPDPTVASSDIQKGEFVGWIDRDNYMNLLSDEGQPNSGKFNVKYLKAKKDKRSTFALDKSDRKAKFKKGNIADIGDVVNNVDTIKMYITIIPKDWKLSDSEYPEKWYFELASDDIIVACERADHNHGMYPVSIASPEFDGYSSTPISRMEILYGLQHTLDFFFNSHVENVRKSINDMFIVDPFLVNIEDLKDPQPGKLIRLRRPAWGRGVDKVVQQLSVQDITRNNIADSAYVTQWMDRISGADQSMQGALRQGGPERLTSAEFQGTRGSAISRLQRIAMVISMQFMQDIGNMFAVHSQQYMEQETYVKAVGNHGEMLKKTFGKDKLRVDPSDIAINYDLLIRDGSIPGGNFSPVWVDLFKTIGGSEELMQQFDVARIFMYIAQNLGAKNVEDFKRNVNQVQQQVMPNEQVDKQVQAGNLISMEDLQ